MEDKDEKIKVKPFHYLIQEKGQKESVTPVAKNNAHIMGTADNGAWQALWPRTEWGCRQILVCLIWNQEARVGRSTYITELRTLVSTCNFGNKKIFANQKQDRLWDIWFQFAGENVQRNRSNWVEMPPSIDGRWATQRKDQNSDGHKCWISAWAQTKGT